MINNVDSGFYQFKMGNKILIKQEDDRNYGLGTIMTIMRFTRAFENNKVKRQWICKDKECSQAIIPSTILIGGPGIKLLKFQIPFFLPKVTFSASNGFN